MIPLLVSVRVPISVIPLFSRPPLLRKLGKKSFQKKKKGEEIDEEVTFGTIAAGRLEVEIDSIFGTFTTFLWRGTQL